ncbi:unnamed protein product [Blepharisma stoltei]|uniref:Uncharacterized protein n=1 Tax=Blepharisma stoltei TaxID=1481888 RepID=A0AAU9ISS1_9CILI|nr:unnamed protein product [Blepharisma stoltei]
MDYLIDTNRGSLRSIFSKHSTSHDNPVITYNELFKFCTAVRIFPDLLSSFEIKRLVMKSSNSHGNSDKRIELSYLQFEKLLKSIANHCFTSGSDGEKLKLLFAHIKNSCKLNYHVDLNIAVDSSCLIEENSLSNSNLNSSNERSQKQRETLRKSSSGPKMKKNVIKKSLTKCASLKLPSADQPGNRTRIVSPRIMNPTPRVVNKKVKQLYQAISPRHLSARKLASRSPDSKHEISSSIDQHSTRLSKPLEIPKLGSPLSSSQFVISNLPTVKNSTHNKLSKVKSAFDDFRKKHKEIVAKKPAGISPKMLRFIKSSHKNRFENKFVTKLFFELWRVKTIYSA